MLGIAADRLAARLEAFEQGDLDSVLEDEALADADLLIREAGPLELVAWLHWYRYGALPPGDGRADLAAALVSFAQIYADDENALPEEVRVLFDGRLGTDEDAVTRGSLAVELLSHLTSTYDERAQNLVIEMLSSSVDRLPDDHPDYPRFLAGLALMLRVRFRQAGVLADANAAVDAERRLVTITADDDPDRAGNLSSLATTLMARFGLENNPADMEQAIVAAHESVRAAADDDPEAAFYLFTQATIFQTRAKITGSRADFDEAVTLGRRAVARTSAESQDRAVFLLKLSGSLQLRFERTGHLADLHEAVETGRSAAAAAPPDGLETPSVLANLATALQIRFDHTGESQDLDEAVHYSRQAVAAVPAHDGASLGSELSNLSLALRARYERFGASDDIDEAVAVSRQAVQAIPDWHPARAAALTNLGATLRIRFNSRFDGLSPDDPRIDLADVDDAVAAGRAAVQAIPFGDPDRPAMLTNLAGTLRKRSFHLDQPSYMEEAITLGREAVASAPPGHSSLASYLGNLGNALEEQFERTGDPGYLQSAIDTWKQAVEVVAAPVEARIRSAQFQATAVAEHHSLAAALPAYRSAIDLLPLLAWRGISAHDQRFRLEQTAGALAHDAAGSAIASDQPALTVELLEQGRAILWAQLLDLRTDLTQLRQQQPDLAEALTECRTILDGPTPADQLRAGHTMKS